MHKFKIGDRVNLEGSTGTVKAIPSYGVIDVELDNGKWFRVQNVATI